MREIVIVVRCISCKREREVRAGEIGADDYPMCAHDYMPMMPVRAGVALARDPEGAPDPISSQGQRGKG